MGADACFNNDELLSLFGGETPSGIPAWIYDPDANPATAPLDPLEIDQQPSSTLVYSPLTESVSVHPQVEPEDIPNWTADPSANPTKQEFEPLNTD